jgi:hypothetical protein
MDLQYLLHVSVDCSGSYGSIIVGRAAACTDHGSSWKFRKHEQKTFGVHKIQDDTQTQVTTTSNLPYYSSIWKIKFEHQAPQAYSLLVKLSPEDPELL